MALIKFKRRPSSDMASINLQHGEPAFATDTKKLYIGDGAGGKVLINPDSGTGGGGTSDIAWKPTVSPDGDMSWQLSASAVPPEPLNIRGPQGSPGANATINGFNVFNIVDGENTTVSIDGNSLRINAVNVTNDTQVSPTMPHIFTDGTTSFRYGFKTDAAGNLIFMYEEV